MYCKGQCSVYHKTHVTVSARVSLALRVSAVGRVKNLAVDNQDRRRRPTSCSLSLGPLHHYPVLHLATNTTTTNTPPPHHPTNKPPPPTNNYPQESQLRTASASSPHRAYSITSLSPTDAGPGRRNHVDSRHQRHHTKRSLIRHPRARCRYRASRYLPLREIAVPPDLQRATGNTKRKDLQH
jgi:hypothetical protein